jgi:hypothetical protein
MADSVATTPQGPAASGAPALDELMLAMDVVDTLRHDESVALRELEQDGRDGSLKQRLRSIYEGQGLEVSDRILDEGIRALRESRFTYTPTPPSFKRTLAGLWIRRGTIVKALAVLVVVLAAWIGWSIWQDRRAEQAAIAAQIELTETLPRQIEAAAQEALSEARTPDAQARAEQLHADAQAALSRSDAEAARVGVASLQRLAGELRETYTLRIVARPGEQSGVYRIPDVNSHARNYYLIVEAVRPDGSLATLPVTSEEDGKTANVTKWALRVPQATYDAVARDKTDDGIVQNNILGEKPRGALEPTWRMNVSGGAITEW